MTDDPRCMLCSKMVDVYPGGLADGSPVVCKVCGDPSLPEFNKPTKHMTTQYAAKYYWLLPVRIAAAAMMENASAWLSSEDMDFLKFVSEQDSETEVDQAYGAAYKAIVERVHREQVSVWLEESEVALGKLQRENERVNRRAKFLESHLAEVSAASNERIRNLGDIIIDISLSRKTAEITANELSKVLEMMRDRQTGCTCHVTKARPGGGTPMCVTCESESQDQQQ